MSNNLPDRIMNLYGSAYLMPFYLDKIGHPATNSDLEFIPATERPSPGNRLAWTAIATAAALLI
jgi:hypothetical protein